MSQTSHIRETEEECKEVVRTIKFLIGLDKESEQEIYETVKKTGVTFFFENLKDMKLRQSVIEQLTLIYDVITYFDFTTPQTEGGRH